ncbi:MAG: hypothetical protein HY918_00715 [Candidatus Doudnabacteria bacterium]|nr:hypothetical protein [Candidatus Doudnabacteria bacterium]
MFSDKVYQLYKPFRNHLRHVAVENAFFVIWAYANFFQFDTPFPKNIEVHQEIHKTKNLPNRPLHEWELSLLAREIVINGQSSLSFATKSFQNWMYFSDAINKLKDFENKAWPVFGGMNNIQKEIRRISHRQFPWQARINTSFFLRYYKIYNNPLISKIIEEKIGMTLQQWYTIGTALFGATLTNPKFNIDTEISISNITMIEFNKFLNHTSIGLDDLKKLIKKEVYFDDRFIYSFNPLEYYPLINIGLYYYCPIPTLLAWRITSGIYFDLINEKSFGHPFGFAYQNYIEEITKVVLDKKQYSVHPEQKYIVNGGSQDSIDLIVSQNNSALFIEAKAKRLTVKSKSELVSDSNYDKDLNTLADDVAQAYATIDDYLGGCYKHFPYTNEIKIYPLIVTLEEWYLLGEDVKALREKVKIKITQKGLALEYLDSMPYTVCSTVNYEAFVQILNKHSIVEVMDLWLDPERYGHNFGQFLSTNYKREYKFIDDYFPGEFEKIYPKGIISESI